MDPITDSGGRVTRSLRKRISSVDGDSSSRPGTPVPSKLTAITETSSPSRPTRMTRRNSTTNVATPAKRSGTPSIITDSTETLTPARRNTRRRSISNNEGEETPQTIKAPAFEAVAEEITTSTKPTSTTRVTRLQSKSPEVIQANSPASQANATSPESIKSGEKNTKTKSLKRRKPGPKSKTRLSLEEDLSDVEVIIVEKEETDESKPTINDNIVDLLDCDDDSRQLDNNISGEKSQMEKEKKNSTRNSTSKDEMKNSNLQITSVTNVNESDTKLLNEELAKEKDVAIGCSDTKQNPLLGNLNVQKTDKTSQEETNVTIIDLMDCDDEPQVLSNTKSPEEKKVNPISTDSPKRLLSESRLENDKKTESTDAQDENIFDIDDEECIKIANVSNSEEKDKKTDPDDQKLKVSEIDDAECIPINEEKANESEREEIAKMDSTTVINETLLNNSKSESSDTKIKEIDANELKIKESPMKNLQDKDNLAEINIDDQNDEVMVINSSNTNSMSSEDIPIQSEKPAYQQKDIVKLTPERKSTATVTEVITINSTLASPTHDKPSKKVDNISSPRLSGNKLGNLNVLKTEKADAQENKNISIIDLMDCDDEPQQLPEENKITTISNDSSPKSILSESNLENDKKSEATDAANENIFEVDDSECITIANESNTEEISMMDSIAVIDETLFNKTIPEKSKTEESSMTNIQQKENLTELDNQNECMSVNPSDLNDKNLDEIPKPAEKLSYDTASLRSQRKSTATITEVININSALETIQVIPTKKVDFSSSPVRDNSIKSVYPKTPAMIKSKRFIEMDSERDENKITTGDIPKCPQDEICEMEIDEQEVVEDQEQIYKICEQNTSSKEHQVSENKQESLHELPQEKDGTKQFEEVGGTVISIDEELNEQVTENIDKEKDNTKQLEELGGTIISIDEESNEQVTENIDKEQLEEVGGKIISIDEESNEQVTENIDKEKDSTKQLEEEVGGTVMSIDESNEHVTENIVKESSPKEIENQLKWINPSVKGYTNETSKLDEVVEPVKTSEKCFVNNDKDEKKFTPNKRKGNAILFSSDSNDEEEKIEDDEEEVELAPGEKPYKRSHTFHDDEAIEVDDYASGDSMDSEERREIIENEIPIDGESIGSATTDDEHDDDVEGEESENDSFIVSDNEVEENESTDSDDEGDTADNNDRKKKKVYKRINHPTESSSSSDDLDKAETDMDINVNTEKNEFDSSKLSDTALRLQCTAESESEEVEENKAELSRKEILRKLNQSDRFNKSVRDLNPETDTSPIEINERELSKVSNKKTPNISDSENDSQMSITEDVEEEIENDEGDVEEEIENDEGDVEEEIENDEGEEDQDDENSCADQDSNTSSPDEDVKKNSRKHKRERGSESQLGEVSVTTESDGDKENNHKNPSSSNRMPGGAGGLSVSFGNFKKANKKYNERKEWQRSFTIGVSVKGCDLGTAVTENKSTIENSAASPISSPNVEQDDELSSDDVHDLEKIRHMPLPLGNPLVRTRRQSLALPSNPDKDICSSPYSGSGTTKKAKRKSLGLLSTNDFNPSQSFIDSIEMRKNEFVRNSAKRKRLSKSFCGAAETLDNSVIDIDVAHLHKRSKLAMDNSMMENYHDSIENINSCKLSSKTAISSTPCDKVGKKDSNNNVQRILSRCDEILEAANRAKLEDKMNNKKSKVKLPKKNRKKPQQRPSEEVHQGADDDDETKISAKQKKHNDKIRAAALAQALKAADEVILGKKIQQHQRTDDPNEEEDSKRISSDVLEEIAENVVKKHNQKDMLPTNYGKKLRTTATTSGNFVEIPQTPEKKKKKKRAEIIQLPTGKMCVEPITPKCQRSVLACNGTEFHESPVTPFAVGFKVRHIPNDDHTKKHASALKDRKRKRNFDEQPMHTLPQPQWTQSGLFIEEEISTMRRIARSEVSQLTGSRNLKKLAKANDEQNAYCNFKQNALMRGDIKRCTTREILQLKERRQMQNQF